MHLRFWLLSGCLAAVSFITKAHPQGGDSLKGYCGDLTPKKSNGAGHDGVEDQPDSKFTVKADPTTLDVSGTTTVTIEKAANVTFKGFLCIVSNETETASFKPVGEMKGTSTTQHTTTVDCKDAGTATGASHFNAGAATRAEHDSATFTWTASGVAAGKYKLRCTVVESKSHAYTGYTVPLTVKADPGHTTSNKAGTTTQKSSSPRNMASGFNIMAAAIVAVKILSG